MPLTWSLLGETFESQFWGSTQDSSCGEGILSTEQSCGTHTELTEEGPQPGHFCSRPNSVAQFGDTGPQSLNPN